MRYACELRVVASFLDPSGDHPITGQKIAAAARRWARQQQSRGRSRHWRTSTKWFVQLATAWLRFLGRLAIRLPTRSRFAAQNEEWTAFLRQGEGLRDATVANYGWWIRRFLAWLEASSTPLSRVRIAQVDAFLQELSRRGLSRCSLATAAKSLRRFFRFARQRGWCRQDLAPAILGPRLFRHEDVPTGPAWADVRRLMCATNGAKPSVGEVRARAMLWLCAIYGLRSGEVRSLRLDDIDWCRRVFRIRRGKSTRIQEYPLTRAASQALGRYLREARPTSQRPEFFLSLLPPFRPLSAGALYHLTQTLFRRWNIRCPKRGPHALRHACATHLLSEGLSLQEIGEHLGHRHVGSTRLYAKVDAPGLRTVADWDLGGVI